MLSPFVHNFLIGIIFALIAVALLLSIVWLVASLLRLHDHQDTQGVSRDAMLARLTRRGQVILSLMAVLACMFIGLVVWQLAYHIPWSMYNGAATVALGFATVITFLVWNRGYRYDLKHMPHEGDE